MADKRKSIIKKGVRRELNTSKFFMLHVFCEYEEEVDWESIEERQDKSDKITKLLLLDFEKTLATSLNRLGLKDNSAYGN